MLRQKLGPRRSRQAGVALLLTTVTIAVIGATTGEFAYNAQVDLEAAANSRDMLRAEYMARASLQMGRLLVAVQGMIDQQMQSMNVPPEFQSFLVITDYAGFLAKAFGGDKEAREGLGGFIGLDLGSVKGLDTPKGTSFDLSIGSEEGKFFINCGGGGNPNPASQLALYRLLSALIRPLRYDYMFNVPDVDGVVVSREDLPRAIIDWTDVDLQRFEPLGGASAGEERYDRGRDRYEAHNQNMDTIEELNLVRGVGEDFWSAFGELFTVYGSNDCRVLASAVSADSWPLVAAMIAASSSDPNVVYDPNTALVAQQVAALLKNGLPLLKQIQKAAPGSLGKCDPGNVSQCPKVGSAPQTPQPSKGPQLPAGLGPGGASATDDSIDLLSNLVCTDMISQLPGQVQALGGMLGVAPPPVNGTLRRIPMCPGMLGQYLREKPAKGSPRRYYRIDATGIVQRNAAKATQVHIRAVWDAQGSVYNPLCNNHPSCTRGTWVYYRMD